MTMANVIDMMRDRYAHCSSFVDSGTLRKTFISRRGLIDEKNSFVSQYQVTFVRHRCLEIVYAADQSEEPFGLNLKFRYDSNGIRLSQERLDSVLTYHDLSIAISSITPGTGGMVHLWAGLLLPDEVRGSSFILDRLDVANARFEESGKEIDAFWICSSFDGRFALKIRARDMCVFDSRLLFGSDWIGQFASQQVHPVDGTNDTSLCDMLIEVRGSPSMGEM